MLKECLRKYKSVIAFYLINGLIAMTASTLAIVYFQKLIDSVGVNQEWSVIIKLLITYGVLQMFDYLLNYLDNYPSSKLSNGFYYELKIMAMKKISTIKYLEYKKLGTGELIQQIENGADAGRNILFGFYLNLFRYILPLLILSITTIGLYDYKVLIGILISYAFVYLITKLLLKKLYLVKNTILKTEEMFSSKAVRAFMEMVIFRTNRRYNREINEARNKTNKIISSKIKIIMTHELFFTSFAIIVAIIKVIAIYIGIKQISIGLSSIGTIVAIVTLIDRVYQPIAIFNVEYVNLKLNRIGYKRFKDLMEKPDDDKVYNGNDINISSGNIRFQNISYKYDDLSVLENVTVEFSPGKSYAIVGQSGAGKTTILELLAGLLKPDSGEIKIDNQPLSSTKLDSYYKHTTYLSQLPSVFDGSIRENLAFDNEISDSELWTALEKVNLSDRVNTMDDKLDENIGERGNKLSGGEKQRLVLARTIILKPKIIILDECTSALDSINEEQVMSNFFSSITNSTIIAVTHRVHTTHRCANVSMAGAIGIGALCGVLVVFAVEFVEKVLKVDDPVGAVSVHGVCGAFGTLMVGIFATDGGLLYGGGLSLLGVQAIGVFTVMVWTLGTSFVLFYTIKKTTGLRVSESEEMEGLDYHEHGSEAYADFTMRATGK
jgi:ATP-binding cassette subfamily B protein